MERVPIPQRLCQGGPLGPGLVLVLLLPSAVERQGTCHRKIPGSEHRPGYSTHQLCKSLNFSDPQGFLLKMGAKVHTTRLTCVRFRPGWMTRDRFRAGSSCLTSPSSPEEPWCFIREAGPRGHTSALTGGTAQLLPHELLRPHFLCS